MSTFLGAEYCAESEVGGCAVRNARTRHTAFTLNGKPSPSVDEAQRFDLIIVLRGGVDLRRRFFAHKAAHDIDTEFTLPVPLDKEIPLPDGDDNHARLTAEADQGSGTINVRSQTSQSWTAYVGMPFTFAGHDRLYTVGGETDVVVPTTGSAELTVFPALKADVASGVLMDFKPSIPALYLADAGFSIVEFDEQDTVIVRFEAANAI